MTQKECPLDLTMISHFDFEVGESYALIDIKTFRASRAIDEDARALSALVQNSAYCDVYTGEGPQALSPPRHGPYWLDRIGVEHFTKVGIDSATERLVEWMEGLGDVLSESDRQIALARVTHLLDAVTTVYELADLRAEAEHDYGELVAQDGFNELVLIGRDRHTVTLLVTWDD